MFETYNIVYERCTTNTNHINTKNESAIADSFLYMVANDLTQL